MSGVPKSSTRRGFMYPWAAVITAVMYDSTEVWESAGQRARQETGRPTCEHENDVNEMYYMTLYCYCLFTSVDSMYSFVVVLSSQVKF